MRQMIMKTGLIIVGLLGLFCLGLIAAESPGDEQKPYDVVKKASIFCIGPFGLAGTTSPPEKALREIVKQEGAKQVLIRLLDEATPEGQMYALVGLKAVDPAKFKSRLKLYAEKSTQMKTAKGCIVSQQPISEVVKAIAAGRYDLSPWVGKFECSPDSSGRRASAAFNVASRSTT
jgi:hypothetical protein